jgi:hypothetical protein
MEQIGRERYSVERHDTPWEIVEGIGFAVAEVPAIVKTGKKDLVIFILFVSAHNRSNGSPVSRTDRNIRDLYMNPKVYRPISHLMRKEEDKILMIKIYIPSIMKKVVFFLGTAFLLLMLTISPAIAADDTVVVKPPLSLPVAISSAFAGVFLSFIIPVVAKYGVKVKNLRRENKPVDHSKEILDAATPYFFTAIQSFLIAVVVVAAVLSQGTSLTEWYVTFIAGYTFDATIQKVKAG